MRICNDRKTQLDKDFNDAVFREYDNTYKRKKLVHSERNTLYNPRKQRVIKY